MKNRMRITTIVLAAAFMLIVPVMAVSNDVQAKMKTEGNRILLYGADEVSVPADEPCYVSHGSKWDWKSLTPLEKRMSLSDRLTFFELYIDGESVELKKKISHFDGIMSKLWYVQFEEDHFTVGTTHDFYGVWHEWGVVFESHTIV